MTPKQKVLKKRPAAFSSRHLSKWTIYDPGCGIVGCDYHGRELATAKSSGAAWKKAAADLLKE